MENNSVKEQIAEQDRVAAAKLANAGGFVAPTAVKPLSRYEKLKAARALGRKIRRNRASRETYADPIYRAAILERRRLNYAAKKEAS